MRILFFATYPTQATGYARIGNILSNFLADNGHDVHYIGISNFEDQAIDRYIHPNIKMIDALKERNEGSTEMYGVDIMNDIIERVKPDIVFIYNDIIVINRIINEFITKNINKTFKLCIYLDLVYEYEKLIYFKNINIWSDLIFAFSECWKKNLLKIGIQEEKICILPHGIDSDKFYKIDVSDSKQFFGFKNDDFVVLNTNRNSYRKAIDISIDAFIKFLKKNNYDKKIKLFLNLVRDDEMYNLLHVICMKNNVNYEEIVQYHIFTRSTNLYLEDNVLNKLYNACDVGLNTCLGEGFGLCNLEHACVGKPQIVTRVGALNDIFTNDYATLINSNSELYISSHIDGHLGYIKICDPNDFSEALDRYYKNKDLMNEHGIKAMETLKEKYNWDNILQQLNANINHLNNNISVTIKYKD